MTLVLLMAFSTLSILSVSNAHVPPWQIPTYLYITAAPNPVGVNQDVFVMYWFNIPPPTAAGSEGDRWRDITITVAKPDGTTQSLGTFTSDAVGSGGTIFTPTQTGTYTFTVNFPGQTLSLTGPTGAAGIESDFVNDTYLASSATTTLTVQQEQVTAPESYPLPTGYWTRPIEGQNYAWASIASNWLGSPQIEFKVQPNGIAPETSHIMWTKQLLFGGIVGGNYAISDAMSYYSGPQYETKFSNPIIINGYLYYSKPLSDQVNGAGVACVDLTNGKEIWVNREISSITYGQLYDYESMNQHGVVPNGYLWASSGTTRMAYDPLTGLWLFNLTNVPSGTLKYGPNGEILIYQMNYAKRWLALWNNTAAVGELAGTSGSNALQWRPVGKNIDAGNAYSWNVTLPSLTGIGTPAIIAVTDSMIFGRSTDMQSVGSTSRGSGTPDTYTLWAISIEPSTRGQLLWIRNYSAPSGNMTALIGPVDGETGVFTIEYRETMQWYGYDLYTGDKLWGPTTAETAWNYWSGTSGALTSYTIAYGNLYTTGYGGVVYCYNLRTGETRWTYGNGGEGNSTSSGLITVYGNYPVGFGAVADGKIYLYSSEHSPNAPAYSGTQVRCIDAFTGAELWTIDGWVHTGTMAVADGYLIYNNLYDSQIYSVGRGPSKITVSADAGVGNIITIQGSVTDVCEGAKALVESGEFNVVPAVSDEYMNEWMAYLHMQKPMPTDAIGVDVTIYVTDKNGNTIYTGQAISSISGEYAISWEPTQDGLYTVTAVFDGTNGYYGSTAETHVSVKLASQSVIPSETTPAITTTPQFSPPTSASPTAATSQPGQNTSTETLLIIGAAVVIVAVIGAAAVLLRKRI